MTDLEYNTIEYTDPQTMQSINSIRESIRSSIIARQNVNQEGDLVNIIRYINDCGAISLSNTNVQWQGKSDMDKIKHIASIIIKPYERLIDLNQ